MNKVILIGRLTKDVELSFTPSGAAVSKFTLAVDRGFTGSDGVKTDFINIVCWNKLAELVANNLGKGRLVAIDGSMQIRNYTPQGSDKKVYITEVIAKEVKFLDYPKDGSQNTSNNEFIPVDDEDIPF